jgi:RNA polymerase sigma-54 factor
MNMNLAQEQRLLMTPQLEYSLKILKMNNEELLELIDEEVQANPILEYAENTSKPSRNMKDSIKDTSYYDEYGTANFNEENDEFNYINSIPDASSLKPSLVQHLLLQLHTEKISGIMMELCEFIIESIDSNGYFTMNEKEIKQVIPSTSKEILRAIELVQSFDPPGVGARNLKECLLLQIVRNNMKDRNLIIMVDNYLEDIAANRIPYLSQVLGLEIPRINQLIAMIKGLDPKPGSRFSLEIARYIKPDVVVCKNDDQFEVMINKEQLPNLNVSTYYSGLLTNRKQLNSEEYSYINKNYTSATWLMRCIEQRLNTLERVTSAIVLHQIAFFEFGKKHLMPLTLKEIAYELDIHESTVSRAVNEKYLLCQWGVYELKYFFSSKTIRAANGEDVSSSNAKLVLKEIIDEEDKSNPLSDTTICKILQEKDIFISRRTVAKYRAQLKIPTMDLRKHFNNG